MELLHLRRIQFLHVLVALVSFAGSFLVTGWFFLWKLEAAWHQLILLTLLVLCFWHTVLTWHDFCWATLTWRCLIACWHARRTLSFSVRWGSVRFWAAVESTCRVWAHLFSKCIVFRLLPLQSSRSSGVTLKLCQQTFQGKKTFRFLLSQ